MGSAILKILGCLKKLKGPFTQRELARKANVSPSSVNYWIHGLKRVGLVKRIESGKHRGKYAFFTYMELEDAVNQAFREGPLRGFGLQNIDLAKTYVLRVKEIYYAQGVEPPDEKKIEDLVRIKLAKSSPYYLRH